MNLGNRCFAIFFTAFAFWFLDFDCKKCAGCFPAAVKYAYTNPLYAQIKVIEEK